MLVRCPSCAAQLRLDQAPTEATTLRCPACSTTFTVRPGEGSSGAAPTPLGAAAPQTGSTTRSPYGRAAAEAPAPPEPASSTLPLGEPLPSQRRTPPPRIDPAASSGAELRTEPVGSTLPPARADEPASGSSTPVQASEVDTQPPLQRQADTGALGHFFADPSEDSGATPTPGILDTIATDSRTEESFQIPLEAFEQPAFRAQLSGAHSALDDSAPDDGDDNGAQTALASEATVVRPSPVEESATGELESSRVPEELHSFLDGDDSDKTAFFGEPLDPGASSGGGFAELNDGEGSMFGAPLFERRQDSFQFDAAPPDGSDASDAVRAQAVSEDGIRRSATVTKQVDPLMEFGDMFREVREAVGDRGARDHLDPSLFDEHAAPPGAFEARASSGENLVLKAGKTERDEDPFRREAAPVAAAGVRVSRDSLTREKEEQSRLIDIALRNSGLNEPVPEEPTAAPPAPRRAAPSLDVRDEVPHARGALSSALLVVALTLAGVLAFVARANGGVLDFRDPEHALAVAFRGAEPRALTSTEAEAEGDDAVRALPTETPTGSLSELDLVDVMDGFYRTQGGQEFALVEGQVQNNGDGLFRRVRVEVTLLDARGEVVAERVVPIGRTIEQPALETIAEAEALAELYRELETEGDPLTLANNQLSPFSAVFFVSPDQDIDTYSVRARLSSAERGGECWTALEVAGDDDP